MTVKEQKKYGVNVVGEIRERKIRLFYKCGKVILLTMNILKENASFLPINALFFPNI